MTYARTTLAVVAVITMAGAVLADLVVPDLAAQHAFNDNWPPHAEFHDAQYVVITVLLGIIGLVLLRRGPDMRSRLLAYDPEFHDSTLFVFGLHGQVFLAILLLVALISAVVSVLRTDPRFVRPARLE